MTVEVAAPAPTYERGALPDEGYRQALVALLAAHAQPAWGWGQRGAYERLAMAGPSLDQWVRTTGLWAEQERMAWEWEQLVAGVTDADPGRLVPEAIGQLAERTTAAIGSWIDLMALSACLDGLGEDLVRTLAASSYAPLQRHARLMVASKRGQAADAGDAVAQALRLDELDRPTIGASVDRWLELAGEHAHAVAACERAAGWAERDLAAPFDADAALARLASRLHRLLGRGAPSHGGSTTKE